MARGSSPGRKGDRDPPASVKRCASCKKEFRGGGRFCTDCAIASAIVAIV